MLKNITSKASYDLGPGGANPKHDPNPAQKCTELKF